MAAGDSLTFGDLLRRYREAAGLTQEALAERARLSARAISDLERGVKHRPRHDTAALLGEALQLSTQERTTFVAAARRLSVSSPARSGVETRPQPSSTLPPIVGRARELALLERHLGGEGPRVLLLAGEPGIGKSRLLGEVAQRAPSQGWQMLEGSCQRRGGQEPYAPLLGALKRRIGGQAPVHLRADLQGCAWLVRLLPELAEGPIEPLPPWTLPPEQERRLMFEAVARFLVNVAGPAGTLLVLDDLQWAGSDALDLLATLVRSTAVPLRVVGAYRDTEVQREHPLSVALADLAHAGLAAHRTLAPLTLEEAGLLLDGLLEGVGDDPTGLREQVVQRAGGVPFFIVSCVQALRRGESEGDGRAAVPWDLAQGIRQRVAALPEVAQEMLGVAAVVGRRVPCALLVSVTAQPVREVLAALRAACRARLLEEEDEENYRFAHDVIREVVEADLGATGRSVLHRSVAEALEQRPGEPPAELLAYHYSRGGAPDKAVLYLEQAGDRAQAQYANAAAEGYYRELVERLDRLGRSPEAARACAKLGAVLMTVGRYDVALELLEEAAETYQAAGDLERWGGALAQMGHLYSLSDREEEGVARLQPFVARLEASGAWHGLATLHAALAELFWGTSRLREGLAAAERAAEFARAVGDHKLLGTADERRATLLLSMAGRLEEALHIAEEACRAAEAAGDLEILCWALLDVAGIYQDRGEFDTTELYLERALDMAEQQGNPLQTFAVTRCLAWLTFLRGNWDQARLGLQRAEAIGRQAGWRQAGLGWLLLALDQGHLALAEGARDEASRLLEDCVTKVERSGWLGELRRAQRLLAERDLLEGRPEVACSRLVPLLDRPGLEESGVTNLLPVLAWAHLELGETAEAEQVVAEALARIRADNNRLDLVDALRVQAMVAIRQERWAEAEHSLEEGVALARSMPYPYAEARLLHAYGAMHAHKGEPEPARERLEAARAIFRRLGARKDAERVEQALATLPHAPPRDAAGTVVLALPRTQGAVAGAPATKRPSRTQRQAWALEYLRTAGSLSPRAYATALGVSVDTALRDLQELVDRGLVQAAGTTRDRRYVLAGQAVGPAIHRMAP